MKHRDRSLHTHTTGICLGGLARRLQRIVLRVSLCEIASWLARQQQGGKRSVHENAFLQQSGMWCKERYTQQPELKRE
jgi:hypothetical protein